MGVVVQTEALQGLEFVENSVWKALDTMPREI
jgi:hypothetical protein